MRIWKNIGFAGAAWLAVEAQAFAGFSPPGWLVLILFVATAGLVILVTYAVGHLIAKGVVVAMLATTIPATDIGGERLEPAPPASFLVAGIN